jgi:hypothetical protein
MRKPGELAVGLAVAFAGVAAGYAVYSYWKPVGSGRMPTSSVVLASSDLQPEPAEVAEVSEPGGAPVRVANPFDSSEVFEFPYGTSEADAREAIAGFLMERAVSRGVTGARKRSDTKS